MSRETWTTRLSVDKRIVGLLSASTYEDFPGAIREMVSNSYDADATRVNIRIDLENDIIEIVDDGIGMTPNEFQFFLRIAGQKAIRRVSPELGRDRIGQFGIGFLAVFPFGKQIRVISSALRSDIHFEAVIPAEQYIRPEKGVIDVEKIPIPGRQTQDRQYLSEHGTTIQVLGLTELAKMYFQERDILAHGARNTIRAWAPLDRLMWSLKEDLPIDYPQNSPFKSALADLGSSGLRVFLNGEELFRNAPGSDILENDTWEHNGILCRYVIATNWKSIVPAEERFLKQRLKNVGIGRRTSFELGLAGRAYSRLHWLTGEIRILKGLDNLLSIDRSRFVDSIEYDKYAEFFRGRLAHFAHYVEDVAEAERDIKRQLTNSRIAEVGSRREIIDRKIKTLKSKGFEVKSKSVSTTSNIKVPVKVDVDKKIVEVVDDHPALKDQIVVDGKPLPIRYEQRGKEQKKYFAVRRDVDGTITVNSKYSLFQSRRYGEMLKKIFVVMLLLIEETDLNESILAKFTEQLEVEFKDLV
jgi:hypothetical protein